MPALLVSQSPPLSGEVTIHGAKNSVLPILAATLLCRTPCVLHNCPDILDVTHALAILCSLGCAAERRGASVYIDPRGCAGHSVPPELAASMRASSLFLGALLARQGEASLSLPGGCPIGARPVDLSSACLPRARRRGHGDGRYHSLLRAKADRRKNHTAWPQRRRNRKRYAGCCRSRGCHCD